MQIFNTQTFGGASAPPRTYLSTALLSTYATEVVGITGISSSHSKTPPVQINAPSQPLSQANNFSFREREGGFCVSNI